MGADFDIVEATEEHAGPLAANMRPEVVREVMSSGGFTPLDATLRSLRASSEARTAIIRGQVAAIWGVMPIDLAQGIGAVWLLTGEAIDRSPLTFLRRCRSEVASMQERWPILLNAIDARYTKALRWAKWVGFELGEPIKFGVQALPFYPIKLRRDAHV